MEASGEFIIVKKQLFFEAGHLVSQQLQEAVTNRADHHQVCLIEVPGFVRLNRRTTLYSGVYNFSVMDMSPMRQSILLIVLFFRTKVEFLRKTSWRTQMSHHVFVPSHAMKPIWAAFWPLRDWRVLIKSEWLCCDSLVWLNFCTLTINSFETRTVLCSLSSIASSALYVKKVQIGAINQLVVCNLFGNPSTTLSVTKTISVLACNVSMVSFCLACAELSAYWLH